MAFQQQCLEIGLELYKGKTHLLWRVCVYVGDAQEGLESKHLNDWKAHRRLMLQHSFRHLQFTGTNPHVDADSQLQIPLYLACLHGCKEQVKPS